MKKNIQAIYDAAKNNDFDTVANILLDIDNEIINYSYYDLISAFYSFYFVHADISLTYRDVLIKECEEKKLYKFDFDYRWENTKEVCINTFEFFYSKIKKLDENIKRKIYTDTLKSFIHDYEFDKRSIYLEASEIEDNIDGLNEIEKIYQLDEYHHYKDILEILLNNGNSFDAAFYKEIISFLIESIISESKDLVLHPYDSKYNFANDFCCKLKMMLNKNSSFEKSECLCILKNKVNAYNIKSSDDLTFIKNDFLSISDNLTKNELIELFKILVETTDSINDDSLYLNMIHRSVISRFFSISHSLFNKLYSIECNKKKKSENCEHYGIEPILEQIDKEFGLVEINK